MAINATGSRAPAALVFRGANLLPRVWARLAAVNLDARLAAGEDPRADAALACRSEQLVSRRRRRRIADSVERVYVERREPGVFSAAIPINWPSVEIARPALEQLAKALRSHEVVEPGGVALTQVLLSDGTGALYRPMYPEELYDAARRALRLLGPDSRPPAPVEVGSGALVMDDQLDPR
jgi:hypothetical protein